MRTYEILDENGSVVDVQEMETSMAPILMTGQHARLVEIDGQKLTEVSKVLIGADAPPMPNDLMTQDEAAAIASQS